MTSAGASPAPHAPIVAGSVSAARALPNGLEFTAGALTARIVAIRDDIIRVRMCVGGRWNEDASWVVHDAARNAPFAVEPQDTADAIGFRTKVLQVAVRRATAQLFVSDSKGCVIHADAEGWPVTFQNGGFTVFKAIAEGEHFYGLGDKTGPLARDNQAFTLWNTDPANFQESTDPIYKSIPFVLRLKGSATVGLLLDNTHRSHFDFGKRIANVFSFGAEGGPLDYYIIGGQQPKDAIRAYCNLTGLPPLPPLWALGYQQSRYSYKTRLEVRAVAAKLRSERIPADVVYFDIDFQDRFRSFTVDANAFPNFPELIGDLAKQNFRAVVITDPQLPVVPDGSYRAHASGTTGDHFIRNADGSIFVGSMWGGPSAYPDFTRKATRAWWGSLYKDFVAQGVAGFWNDMNEPSVTDGPGGTMPPDTVHRIEEPGFAERSASHREVHNIYGMQNSRATYDGLRALAPERRPFVLTRSSFAGGQRYAATWTGDNSATWNHVRLGIAQVLNLGLSGFALSGADLGGFFGSVTPELLTRWYQIGAFMPLYRNHAFKDAAPREPWLHGEPHTSIRRRFVEERYRLLPYIYTLAEEAARTGVPIMRPMFLEFPITAGIAPWYLREPMSQFMLGAAIMVAPAPYAEMNDTYVVTLPRVPWFDYWTGARVHGSGENPDEPKLEPVKQKIETLPVYVRGGSIIPRQAVVQSTAERPEGPLELCVYPGPNCQGSIYADEGDGYRHREGHFLRQRFECATEGKTMRIRLLPRQGQHRPWWSAIRLIVHDIAEEPAVSCSLGPVSAMRHDPDRRILHLELADTGEPGEVVLTAP
jgi:alpha-glucosidase